MNLNELNMKFFKLRRQEGPQVCERPMNNALSAIAIFLTCR